MCALRDVQIPLVAALLFCGSLAKLIQLVRTGAVDTGLGPAVLFPTRLRWPMALAVSVIECAIAVGLIVTAGELGEGSPATAVRLAASLLFLVATAALIELWASRADVGCGCFGDFSTTPVSARTIARSALLAAASLSTIWLPPIKPPAHPSEVAELVIAGVVELVLLGALSPEIGQALIRLGYTEPCELHDVPVDRTASALYRSKQWRRASSIIATDLPVDVWRELCWRYLVYPTRYADGQADIVFAVHLRQRRPTVKYAVVHRSTGQPLPWPPPSAGGEAKVTHVPRSPARIS
jgi:Methylamine utilisation protein MauE